MAFAVPNDISAASGNAVTSANLGANFDSIEAVLNGGITTDHISSVAAIAYTQLDHDSHEQLITATLNNTMMNQVANTKIPIGCLPYDSVGGTQTYTLKSVSISQYVAGTPSTPVVFELNHGDISTGGTLVLATIAPTNASTQVSYTTLATTSFSTVTTALPFFLEITTQGVGYASTDFVNITLKLTTNLRR